MPSIVSTLKESGAVDITLEEHNAEGEQEEETESEISMIELGLLTLAKVSVHELPRGTYALEELNEEREQEEETENEVSMIERGLLTLAKVSDHEPPMVIYETTV